ncbi:MAG: hypothetical protein IIB77_05155 [Proteobacteria bacterium]|nr:hypothetical protein [Pseudomonadota bacterium]
MAVPSSARNLFRGGGAAVPLSAGRLRVVAVRKQIRLRLIALPAVTSQLSGVVVFERGGELVEKVEHVSGGFIRQLGRLNEQQ